MKVRVGNSIADGDTQVIMVYLTEKDREAITALPPGNGVYCDYPDDMPPKFLNIIEFQIKQLKEDCENENI